MTVERSLWPRVVEGLPVEWCALWRCFIGGRHLGMAKKKFLHQPLRVRVREIAAHLDAVAVEFEPERARRRFPAEP
jgi:hypothetical protein